MPIYIARDQNNIPIGAVLSENKKLANAYWQGIGLHPHNVSVYTEDDLDNHPTGVIPLIKSSKQRLSGFGESSETYYVIESE